MQYENKRNTTNKNDNKPKFFKMNSGNNTIKYSRSLKDMENFKSIQIN